MRKSRSPLRFPKHLKALARAHGAALVADYPDIAADEAGRGILLVGLAAWQRNQAIRDAIDEQGLTVMDRWGQPKAHPLLAAERDTRAQYLAALKQLNLDVEPIGPIGRPPGK